MYADAANQPPYATPAQLRQEFVRVYNGDSVSPYQACNTVWALVPDVDFWGHGTSEGPGRVANSANGWKQWLLEVKGANEEVGGGNLKGIISRNLAGMLYGTVPCVDPPNDWPSWGSGPTDDLADYVDTLCQHIDTLDLEDCVYAWYLDDEGLKRPWYDGAHVLTAAKIVHGGLAP